MAVHHQRRWKRSLAALDATDAAIEGAAPGLSRAEFRDAGCCLVERLCDDATGHEEADELCRTMDHAMAESLLTLRMLPVSPAALARTELVPAVRALTKHESERVRGLAREIWRASVEDDLAKVRSAAEKLSQMTPTATGTTPSPSSLKGAGVAAVESTGSDRVVAAKMETPIKILEPVSKTKAAVVVSNVCSDRVEAAKISSPLPQRASQATASAGGNHSSTKIPEPVSKKVALAVAATRTVHVESTMVQDSLPKRTPQATGIASGNRGMFCTDDKMEATKRKLREGYQEAEGAKRQRKIQVIRAPEMVRQRERKQHPIMRERSRMRYASSITLRRCF
ncbi:hypothetical protein ACP70R_036602 [Stipagrostis hirtigluma subsp. patula]